MKDALGHGSSGTGAALKQYQANERSLFGSFTRGAGEYPARGDSSNAAAAQALMSGLKSTMVPIHDSMAGRASNPTSAIDPSSSAARSKGELSAGQKVNRATIMNARYKR